MLREFLRDSAAYGLSRVVTAGVGVISLSVCAHALAPGQYGVVDMLMAVAAVVHIVIVLEIEQGMARYVNAPDAAGMRTAYASTALWFTVAAYSLFVACALPASGLVSRALFATAEHAPVVRVALLLLWATGVMSFAQDLLRFERLALKSAAVTVLYSVTSTGVTAFLLLVARAGVVALFEGQLVAALVSVGLGLWFARSAIRVTFDLRRCREMLAFSVPLVPAGLGAILGLYVDRVAVARMLSVSDLGVYAVGARMAGVMAVALAGFRAAISPLIYQSHQAPETPAQLARLFRTSMLVALSLIVLLGLFSWEIVRLVAPPAYSSARHLLVPLGAAVVLSGIYPFSPGLWIASRTGWIASINLGAGILNIVLNIVLLPRIGLSGAAVATLISALLGAWLAFAMGQRLYPVPFEWRRISAAVALAWVASLAGEFDLLERVGWPLTITIKFTGWLAVSGSLAGMMLDRADLDTVLNQVRASVMSLRPKNESDGAHP